MESACKLKKENPFQNANFLSKLIFAWMVKVFRKDLDLADLPLPLKDIKSENLANKLEKNWENELAKAKVKGSPNLIKAITATFLPEYAAYGMLIFLQVVILKTSQPLILGRLIHLVGTKTSQMELCITGIILVAVVTSIIFLHHHYSVRLLTVGMKVRISLSALLYRKMTKLNMNTLNQSDVGKIINLVSNELNRFDYAALSLHYLWITPIQIAIAAYLLWKQIGVVALVGISTLLVLTLPLPANFGKRISIVRQKVAEKTDHRIRLMNELISGIQVLKMYAWEKPYKAVVNAVRIEEVSLVRTANWMRAFMLVPKIFTERTMLCLTAVTFVLMGIEITAEKLYTLSIFFNVMQMNMGVHFQLGIQLGAEVLVALRRVRKFLLLEENQSVNTKTSTPGKIVIDKIDASWTTEVKTLENIDLEIPAGSLCVIIGPVGAGKSSLLHLLLGELQVKSGTIEVGGSISYASQDPWLFSSSVRNNILFGQAYDQNRYQEVVHMCALEKDFEQFPRGDQTIVGEKGMVLSGGQKARINMARAIYRKADIYILDDPLSAVDAQVGNHLFSECISGYLDSKTRILVTHQLQFLKEADIIVIIKDGKIEAKGTFEELSKSNVDLAVVQCVKSKAMVESNDLSVSRASKGGKSNQEERTITRKSALKEYISSAGNSCMLVFIFLVFSLNQLVASGGDYWLSVLIRQEERKNLKLILEDDSYFAIYIYTGLIISLIFFTIFLWLLFYQVASIASKKLHSAMLTSLLQVSMKFFETNPSGQVLNRFCKDLGVIDECFPRVLGDTVEICFLIVGALVVISISSYHMVMVILFLIILFLKLHGWFLTTAKSIKHIEAITKSPIISHLNSTATGVTTIRASQTEKILTAQFDDLQDVHTSAWFLSITCMESFGLWLDLLCVFLLTCVIISVILISPSEDVDRASVGLTLSQSLSLIGPLQFGMKQMAEVANQLVSVERVLNYTKLEKEGTSEDKKPPKNWPNQGQIKIDNLYLSYDPDDPPVLKNVNVSFLPGEKIGIIGRTGAGKSSLISTIFRLVEFQGSIALDEVDTQTIGLHDVRTKISIIPQKPALFSATVRYNLDPFNEYEDKDLWNALEEVEMKDVIPSLDFQVKEGGSNFSVGQRQLVCLARAVVRNNRILVLDEATANVDSMTDELIQNAIRKKFKNCTVLTIAHRLNTIMDSDRILVLDCGQVVEFDKPRCLLENPDGYFAKLVAEAGTKMKLE